MPTAHCFVWDRWKEVESSDLRAGDLIHRAGELFEVIAPAYMKDGKPHLPANRVEQGPIKLMVGEFAEGLDHVCIAMDLTGAELREYDDGDAQLVDLEAGPGHIFSPRLPRAELEDFCRTNIERYQVFFDQHEARLDRGQQIQLEPWWEGQES
ncbi:hypothetical protein [Kushneria indalinina]|uniref:Uncharacterized protein n=1 Tax=Kushneria indalinina DSM 14324 TaxID=1122140 RepID=A0A3D9DRU1_9GAMM|nr:hypothetical protein [Kushneria indalinina]REC93355.1 hypothetical protein C8D72_3399 [Kushneria indalinina DSM 14324]